MTHPSFTIAFQESSEIKVPFIILAFAFEDSLIVYFGLSTYSLPIFYSSNHP